MLMKLTKNQIDLFNALRRECKKSYPSKKSYILQPNELVLNISEGCNLTCPYCFAGQGKYGASTESWMTPELAYNTVFDTLKKYPSLNILKLFGGEPFMNLRAMRSACKASKDAQCSGVSHLSIGTVTNMTIYTPLHAQLIKEYHLKLTVSVDGPRQIHDHFRRFQNGKGSFDRIRRCLDLYAAKGVVPTAFESVYTPYDYYHGLSFGDVVNYLIKEFGAQWVHVVPALGSFHGNEREQELEFANSVRESVRDFYTDCVLSDQPAKQAMAREMLGVICNPLTSTLWCGLGQRNITVAADGTVYPCYMFLNKRHQWKMADSINNLSEATVPKDIKESLLQASAVNDSRCQTCILREVCRGCPAGVYSEKNDFTGYDPANCAFRFGAVEGILNGWSTKLSRQKLQTVAA